MSHCEIYFITPVLQILKNKLPTYPLLSVWKMGRPHLHLVTPFLPFLVFPQISICSFMYQSAFCCCGNIPDVKKKERKAAFLLSRCEPLCSIISYQPDGWCLWNHEPKWIALHPWLFMPDLLSPQEKGLHHLFTYCFFAYLSFPFIFVLGFAPRLTANINWHGLGLELPRIGNQGWWEVSKPQLRPSSSLLPLHVTCTEVLQHQEAHQRFWRPPVNPWGTGTAVFPPSRPLPLPQHTQHKHR